MSDIPKIQILVDSAGDLPAEVATELGITVVPLLVNFATEAFKDRINLSINDFWQRCAETDELPQTAAPSAEVFEQAYRLAAAEGADEVVAIIVSGALSATIESARRGAVAAADTITVRVIDSKNVSLAQGMLAMLAAQTVRSGASAAAVEEVVEAAIGRTQLHGALNTLENLRKGGRIGAAASLLGSMLSIKPLIQITDGVVVPAGRQRTRGRALAYLHGLVAEQAEQIEQLAVIHAACDDVADFVSQLTPLVDSDILVCDIGPTVGTHVGIGTIGVAFRTRP